MEKIAIIGANRQLGSDIYLSFKENYNVILLLHKNIEITQMDSVNLCLSKIHPDIIINTLDIIGNHSILLLTSAYISASIVFLIGSYFMIGEEFRGTLFNYLRTLKKKIVEVM